MTPALLLAASATHFAPPIAVPLTYVTTEKRVIGGETLTFNASRRIVFTREGDGFVATLTIDRVDHAAGEGAGAMFQAALRAFVGKTLRFHLDAAGTVTAIDNLDVSWDMLCQALAGIGDTPDRIERARTVAAALAALPAESRRAMLGSMIAPLVAGSTAALSPGNDGPVDVPARPPSGAPAMLKGRRTVSRDDRGLIDVSVSARGDVPGDKGPAHLSLTRDDRIDPATGLVMDSHEKTETVLGSQLGSTETTAHLVLPVP